MHWNLARKHGSLAALSKGLKNTKSRYLSLRKVLPYNLLLIWLNLFHLLKIDSELPVS